MFGYLSVGYTEISKTSTISYIQVRDTCRVGREGRRASLGESFAPQPP